MEPIWKVINHTTWRARFDDMIRRDGQPHDARRWSARWRWPRSGRGADYQRAMFQRTDLFRMVQSWFEAADYLVTPTLSRTALPIDQDLFEPIAIDGVEVGELRRNWFPYTMPFNITGHPAITVCCGFAGDGLPIGLQIVGRFRDEASVLRAAALYEASEDWLERWPDLLRRAASAHAPTEIQARVLHRDGLILVIDKPAGLAVHAGPSRAPNLEECFDALRFGLPRPPALAHRLDADTSGVLVLGRHPKALSKLGRLFSGRDTEKTYWAVVAGRAAGRRRRVRPDAAQAEHAQRLVGEGLGQGPDGRHALQGAGPRARHDLARADARDRPHAPDPRALRRTPAAR